MITESDGQRLPNVVGLFTDRFGQQGQMQQLPGIEELRVVAVSVIQQSVISAVATRNCSDGQGLQTKTRYLSRERASSGVVDLEVSRLDGLKAAFGEWHPSARCDGQCLECERAPSRRFLCPSSQFDQRFREIAFRTCEDALRDNAASRIKAATTRTAMTSCALRKPANPRARAAEHPLMMSFGVVRELIVRMGVHLRSTAAALHYLYPKAVQNDARLAGVVSC
jgi:hypothetical protein